MTNPQVQAEATAMRTMRDRLAELLGLRAATPSAHDTAPASAVAHQLEHVIYSRGARQPLAQAPVYTAVSILATAAEQLSFDSYRADGPVQQPRVIARPDPELDSRADWVHEVVTSLSATGNAYLRVWHDHARQPVVARVLSPHEVHPYEHPTTGRRLFAYRGKDYTREEIKHLRLVKVPGHALGLGPIQAARVELTSHADLVEAAASWTTQSGIPSGYLKTQQALAPEARRDLLDAWNAVPPGRTRLLTHGLEYTPVLLSPKDAQWLESRRASKTEIMDLFGIPASLTLGIDPTNSGTYSNVSQDWIGFIRFRLMRYVSEIEHALTALSPRGQTVRANLEALLRSDAETRMRIHAAAIGAGIYSPDYAREIEHIPATAAPKDHAHV